jgi:hypothetical protein
MICGLALNLYLWLFSQISFTWYVVLGSMVTFAVGYAVSKVMGVAEPALVRNEHAN